jgi:hypothetical protein
MRLWLGLSAAVALGGCGPHPVAVDSRTAKTVHLTVTMDRALGAVSPVDDAVGIANAAGGWAVYADTAPVGYFKFGQRITIQVPGHARTLSLNLEEHAFSGRNPLAELINGPARHEGLTDISAYQAGSEINVTCQLNYVQGVRGALSGSNQGLISCAVG